MKRLLLALILTTLLTGIAVYASPPKLAASANGNTEFGTRASEPAAAQYRWRMRRRRARRHVRYVVLRRRYHRRHYRRMYVYRRRY